jgi:hypothetical protein
VTGARSSRVTYPHEYPANPDSPQALYSLAVRGRPGFFV